ncbi:MAG TPA: hypothetical protein VNC22_16970 [Sporichthya sp.]|jgi:hypothetical protein|nr:hypothetical protein [Sporichthya sp.]
MTCPYCTEGAELELRELHAHLATEHAAQIVTEEAGDRLVYVVTCPQCGAQYRKPIKKGVADPGFAEEFAGQIRLVAFDMLLNHLLAEHAA